MDKITKPLKIGPKLQSLIDSISQEDLDAAQIRLDEAKAETLMQQPDVSERADNGE